MIFLATGPGTGTLGHWFQKFLPPEIYLKACIATIHCLNGCCSSGDAMLFVILPSSN